MFDFVGNEHTILKLWQDKDVFSAMRAKTANAKETYKTLDGPITANGSMCIHHTWGRTLKDTMIKYNTMVGRRTHFQNGFDAQGMWVEVEMEKDLGLGGKRAIMDYGLGKFTEKCIERVNHFSKIQTNQSIRLGQIMDWDNSYYTNSDHNIECIWNFLKVCHDRGMLVKSYKAMPWCPRCGTSLSEHEMNGSYKDLTHKAVFVKVKVEGGKEIIIWTTTPWTLSSNVAIAVHPNGKWKDLIGKTYEPILPLKVQNFEHKIVPWDMVDEKEGSGAVHIAPGCGAEDFALGQKLGLKHIVPVDDAGIFTDEFEWLAGKSTTECEQLIFEKLEKMGKIHKIHDHSHSYPYCWRCKTNVIFKLVDGWDIATEKIKPDLLRAARSVKWEPAFLQKTMEDWLANMGDWNISRRRFYGLPLPIYECSCGEITVVGSKKELLERATVCSRTLPHLHRPYIDEIEIKCPHCGKPTKRVPDVGDCWLDAGIAPFSTMAKDYQPAEVVIEMKEQIRLWFYSQLFMSVVLKGKAPYQKVIGYGRILDEKGGMFSKSGPNNIKFDDAIEKFGADVTRYLFSSGNPANDIRFGPNLIDEARRKLLSLHNNFVFFKTYYDIDKPDIATHNPRAQDLSVIDMWLVEVLNDYIKNCQASYEAHKPHEVIEFTETLVEDLSNFYIRVNRRRFWKNQSDQDKRNAYFVLYHTLKSICLVMAPITPFMCETLWQTIIKTVEPTESDLVMTANFATPCKRKNPVKDLPAKVKTVQEIISLSLSLRSRENLKLRQPLSTLYIRTDNPDAVTAFENIIREEVNVRHIEIVKDDTKFVDEYLVVNFKAAGAVLKDKVQALKAELEKTAPIIKGNKVTVGEFKNLAMELFERRFKSKPEYVSVTQGNLTLTLDTVLTDELIEDGILREVIRAIQVERQDQNFDITARIVLKLKTNSDVFSRVIKSNMGKICTETLAQKLYIEKGETELEIDVKLA